MSKVNVFTNRTASHHLTGPGHPERPERIAYVLNAVNAAGLEPQYPANHGWGDTDLILNEILRIHDAQYVTRLRQACTHGRPYIDCVDSAICPASYDVALEAVACVLAGVDSVVSDASTPHAFCAVRPPGHHCERDRSMGFCLFNNIAIAADYALRQYASQGIHRVVIVDFDVHHGNGTQHLFDHRNDVLFISMHQDPATLYPGTGYAWESGTRGTPGAGFTVNIPLPAGSGHDEAINAFNQFVLPRLNGFQPDLIFVSAGFDADERDPLGGLYWHPDTYHELTSRLVQAADKYSSSRIVSVLEGGYDDQALKEDVLAHLLTLQQP